VPGPHWRAGGAGGAAAAAAPVRLVSWLDSKASFADPLALDDSSMGIGRQVKKYLADFGPGMVVFWGGWVDAVAAAAGGGGEFGGGLVVHHRPPAAWRWATREERDAAEAFRLGREEEELGRAVAAGEGGAAAAGLQWEAAPEEGGAGVGAGAPLRAQHAATYTARVEHMHAVAVAPRHPWAPAPRAKLHTHESRPRRHAHLPVTSHFHGPLHGRTGDVWKSKRQPTRPTPPRSTARVAWDPYPRISPTRRPAWMSIFRRPAPACPMRQTMLEPANINPCEHQPPTAAHCLAPW
jgi:hypothetical protein